MQKILISHRKVEIIGDPEFCGYIMRVLDFMSKKIPQRFKNFQKYIGRIEVYSISVVEPWGWPPTCYLSKKTAYYSETWCAGYFVHEAHHAKLYLDDLKKTGKTPPKRIYSGKKIELECLKKQLAASKEMKAPQKEIDHIAQADGSYYKLNQNW